MPALTNKQSLEKLYTKLDIMVNKIRFAYSEVFINKKLCDEPEDRIKTYKRTCFGVHLVTDEELYKQRHARQKLLEEVLEIIVEIKKVKSSLLLTNNTEQYNLDSILNKSFELVYCREYDPKSLEKFTCFNKNLRIGNKIQTLKDIIYILMPKSIVLDHIDSLLAPAFAKIQHLKLKAQKNVKYKNVEFIANQVITEANNAKEAIVRNPSFQCGLREAKTIIENVYNGNNNKEILAEHRGNPIINVSIDIARQIVGYLLLVLTYPARIYGDKVTTAYANSWFEKRQTESFKIFGTFKEGIEALKLPETLESEIDCTK